MWKIAGFIFAVVSIFNLIVAMGLFPEYKMFMPIEGNDHLARATAYYVGSLVFFDMK
ncbi:hypothetical protein LCGC14_1126460 [marine sediment metagenome]|uniref:Uncharacterized protein n=1 Tax=marine sediment metagenome TaxID=412755 RepID=A0A0F9Q890_9ZZZZ